MVYARCLVNADRCKASAVSVSRSVWASESCFLTNPCFPFLLSAHPLWTHVEPESLFFLDLIFVNKISQNNKK